MSYWYASCPWRSGISGCCPIIKSQYSFTELLWHVFQKVGVLCFCGCCLCVCNCSPTFHFPMPSFRSIFVSTAEVSVPVFLYIQSHQLLSRHQEGSVLERYLEGQSLCDYSPEVGSWESVLVETGKPFWVPRAQLSLVAPASSLSRARLETQLNHNFLAFIFSGLFRAVIF